MFGNVPLTSPRWALSFQQCETRAVPLMDHLAAPDCPVPATYVARTAGSRSTLPGRASGACQRWMRCVLTDRSRRAEPDLLDLADEEAQPRHIAARRGAVAASRTPRDQFIDDSALEGRRPEPHPGFTCSRDSAARDYRVAVARGSTVR